MTSTHVAFPTYYYYCYYYVLIYDYYLLALIHHILSFITINIISYEYA